MRAVSTGWLSERWLLIVCIVLGALQAWISRYAMISDGVSYLDIGDAYLRRNWSAAVNAYWSPMYSWWLGVALFLFKPSIRSEYVIVHVVNLIIYFVALFSFRFFIRAVLRMLHEERASGGNCYVPLPDSALLALGYGVFLYCALVLIDVGRVTPDLLVAGILFLIGGYLAELRVQHSYWKFALFGALNGVAYLSKGIMFPLGFGFLAILPFSGKISKPRIAGVFLATGVFLLVSAPFIFALSKAKGRFTFGDTGKLGYAALVSPQTPQIHWQGEPAGSGIPKHATRKLQDNPPVFEFGEPVKGTYPPWDDPSYWNDGVQWHFRVRSQLRVLFESALGYEKLILGELGIVAGALVFIFMGGEATRRAIASNWWLLAAALLSLAAYSPILVITRYVGGSIVLLWVAVFAGIRLPKERDLEGVSKAVAAAVALTICLSIAGHFIDTLYTNATVGIDPSSKDEVEAAAGLVNLGLQAGDRVSVIGYGILHHWARLGRFKIVSEVISHDRANNEFWSLPAEKRDSACESLRSTGAKAVVAWDPPSSKLDARWKRVTDTRYYVYFFSK
jgi:hypothetical protein